MPPDLPPGPDEPAWRQVQRWIEDPVGFWDDCAARFGPTFTVHLGSLGPVVLFARPADVRQVFQLPADSYECRQYNEHYKRVMGGESLLVSDGADHKRRRRLLTPSLQRQKSPGDPAVVRAVTRRVAAAWPTGAPASPVPWVHAVALRVMLAIVFGRKYAAVADEMAGWVETEARPGPQANSHWAQFVHLHPKLRDLISAAVAEARAEPDPGSPLLFDALVLAKDDEGAVLTDAEIQDHIFTLLVAGVDPVAHGLHWALYWVHETTGVRDRLREELAALGPDPDPAKIDAMPYLAAVVEETFRMVPVVATPSGRRLLTPATVGGREYPAGVTLLPCTHLVHRRAETFPEPDRFSPDRFLDKSYPPHEYLPFGGGPRYCIGAWLGGMQVRNALAALVSALDFEPAHTGPVRPVRRGTLLAPSAEMRLTATRRAAPVAVGAGA